MTESQGHEIPAEGAQSTAASGAAAPTLGEALQQIAALDKQLAEANDKMLRALAEVENIRRRAERERQDTARFSVASFARDLLTVSDNLRRALNAIPPDQREKNEQLKTIFAGVEATERELLRVFENNGIKKIEPMHQKFDPNLHEVLFEVESGNKSPGTVVQVVEPGYVIHDRLLRSARVGVAKGGMDGDTSSKIDEQV
ncbi:MAG: nucleotide exchange factor GrpE [Proteobacteria bacterium]|nr:nucleotide exchange factor GrpE [Pseudomonadota bacterium]